MVCEEFVDTLKWAWDEAQSAKAEKQREKKSKRALDNWKLLVRYGIMTTDRQAHLWEIYRTHQTNEETLALVPCGLNTDRHRFAFQYRALFIREKLKVRYQNPAQPKQSNDVETKKKGEHHGSWVE